MAASLLLFGLPTWAVVALAVVLVVVIAFAILKRLFKLALIVAAVAAGVWIARQLVA